MGRILGPRDVEAALRGGAVFAAGGGHSIVLRGVICLVGVAVAWNGIRALLDAR